MNVLMILFERNFQEEGRMSKVSSSRALPRPLDTEYLVQTIRPLRLLFVVYSFYLPRSLSPFYIFDFLLP